MVVQIGSSIFLMMGAIFLVASPTLYLVFRKLYTHAIAEAEENRLDMCQKADMLSQLLGVVFILVAAWKFEVKYEVYVDANGDIVDDDASAVGLQEDSITISDFIQGVSVAFRATEFLFESAGRIFVHGLFMADTVLAMTLDDFYIRETKTTNMVRGKEDMWDIYAAVVNADEENKKHDETRDVSDMEETDAEFVSPRVDTHPDYDV